MIYNPSFHNRRSIRLKGYDYSQSGIYFITICVQNQRCLFGSIIDGKMILNKTGKLVHDEWIKSAEIRKEIEIHEYVIMPNHFHAIAEITIFVGACGIRPDNDAYVGDVNGCNASYVDDVADDTVGVGNGEGVCHTPLRLRSPSKTVGALVRGFKSAVTKQLNQYGFNGSIWQRNYYEHIIREEQSYQNIANYIVNNPANWEKDKFYIKTNP